jgi:hypothetical protein
LSLRAPLLKHTLPMFGPLAVPRSRSADLPSFAYDCGGSFDRDVHEEVSRMVVVEPEQCTPRAHRMMGRVGSLETAAHVNRSRSAAGRLNHTLAMQHPNCQGGKRGPDKAKLVRPNVRPNANKPNVWRSGSEPHARRPSQIDRYTSRRERG